MHPQILPINYKSFCVFYEVPISTTGNTGKGSGGVVIVQQVSVDGIGSYNPIIQVPGVILAVGFLILALGVNP